MWGPPVFCWGHMGFVLAFRYHLCRFSDGLNYKNKNYMLDSF